MEVNLLKAQYEELKISKTKLQIRDTNDSITTKADFDNISEYKIIKQSHEKPILCLAVVTNTNFGTVLVSGGEDYCIKVWNTIDMEMIKENLESCDDKDIFLLFSNSSDDWSYMSKYRKYPTAEAVHINR